MGLHLPLLRLHAVLAPPLSGAGFVEAGVFPRKILGRPQGVPLQRDSTEEGPQDMGVAETAPQVVLEIQELEMAAPPHYIGDLRMVKYHVDHYFSLWHCS